jgi:predicted MFS family arabinose efflux permease
MQALRFDRSEPRGLQSLEDSEWRDTLAFCDSAQLTLQLGRACDGYLPEWVRSRIRQNRADNAQRFGQIKVAYGDLAAALNGAHVEHLVLKGFAQWQGYADPRDRMQGDIDLFCPATTAMAARDAIVPLGYAPIKGFDHSPSDHLPAMVRKSDWRWRGNYFDPQMPLSVDLHFRFWDADRTRFSPVGLEQFWHRRVEHSIDGMFFPTLHPADALGYSALHGLRHLLHGTMSVHNIYEIAWFLQRSRSDQSFWTEWRHLHDPSLRRLEALCFRLAGDWFGCAAAEEVQREVSELPASVGSWFEQYGESPLRGVLSPNKDALWLHLALVESARDRRAIFVNRMFPLELPTVEAVTAQRSHGMEKPKSTLRALGGYLLHIGSRVVHHGRMVPAVLVQGVRWWLASKGFGRQLWIFLGASFLFNSGMYIFFFLFNLYLLDRGFQENFLGSVAAALGVGGLVGTIPGGLIAQRVGLRKTLLLCMTLVPCVFAMRALFPAHDLQIALAFTGGVVISMWAVCVPPTMAQLTTEENRPFGFSLLFAFGIGVGVVAGLAGGSLPGWLARIKPGAPAATVKQWALLVACGISALGLWPAWRLRFQATPSPERRLCPRSRFLLRFLPAIALWSLATGAFSPFFNAYFSKYLHLPVQRIGLIFSGSQLAQVLAILLAPLIFRKFGLISGIMYMQIGTAIALAFLSRSTAVTGVALTYAGFSALQWMSEPGMYSLLMSRVEPSERGGAAALNALVIAGSQAVAAQAAGASFVRFGYPAVLAGTATVAFVAAIAFRLLLREPAGSQASHDAVLASSVHT